MARTVRSGGPRVPPTKVISAVCSGHPRTRRMCPARNRCTGRPAKSGSADSGGPSPSARTVERSSHAWFRCGVSGDTRRTARAAVRAVDRGRRRCRASACGGEGGIRTHEVFRLSAFQERRHQPLGHLSGGEDTSAGRRLDPPSLPQAGLRRPLADDLAVAAQATDRGPWVDRRQRGVIVSRPIAARSGSGTAIEPSGCW